MNPLDEIAARADLAQGAWEDFNLGIATTRFALDEANNSAEDVKPMLAALRSIEDLMAYWDTLADGDRYYAGTIRAAIREALG